METFLKTFFFPSMNNGILFGPWIPVYGFGAVIVVFILRFVFHRIKTFYLVKLLLTLIFVMIFVTLLEWCGGELIYYLFGKVFWDYRHLKFHIGPYIALEMSLLWGVFSLIFIYFIKPVEEVIIKKIPKKVTVLVSVLFLFDVVFTFLLV